MNNIAKRFFKNITPLAVLLLAGIICCIAEIVILFFSADHGGLASGVLGMWATGMYLVFLSDRYLLKKAGFKRTVITELVVIALLPLAYLYINKSITIYIDTTKSWYAIIYSNDGLTKEQIPSSGLFNHALKVKNDSIIYLHSSLLKNKDVSVAIPAGWDGFKVEYLDTVINSDKISIELRSSSIPNAHGTNKLSQFISNISRQSK